MKVIKDNMTLLPIAVELNFNEIKELQKYLHNQCCIEDGETPSIVKTLLDIGK